LYKKYEMFDYFCVFNKTSDNNLILKRQIV
jgi:hypothetical protein